MKSILSLRVLIILLAIIALSSCDHANVSEDQIAPFHDVTDRSACQGPTASDVSLFTNIWHVQKSNGVMTIDISYQFSQTAMTVTSTCYVQDGRSASTSIASPITINFNQVMVLQSNANYNDYDDGYDHIHCKVATRPGSYSFTFAGSCLQIGNFGFAGPLVPN